MPSTHSSRFAGLLVVAVLAVAGCGVSTSTVGADGHASPTTPTGTDAPVGAMVVVRTGGIAGVMDLVRIAADGSATLRSKTSKGRGCTPSSQALGRLRSIDLAAVPAAASPPKMADGFNYSVTVGGTRAVASEGDDDSRRAELVDAAAAVIATCLANQSRPAGS